jgi:hypothetical protein
MSSSVSGRGGLVTIYLKHYNQVSQVQDTASASTYIQTLVELLLLFVNYAEAEINLVGLFEVRLHAHDLREGLFGMLERTITIVENTNAIPKFGLLRSISKSWTRQMFSRTYLWIRQMVQGLLVSRVCLLQVVHHQVTMTCKD